ncbi:MAG: flagellar hook-basal body complex protein FliE [Anaerolinea sp.]|nr:flagellar hook-basal body complex protein FliE [Anaerolinea sp.]
MSIGPIGGIPADLWRGSSAGGTVGSSLSGSSSIGAPAIGTGAAGGGAGGPTQAGGGGSFLDAIGAATAQLNADLVSADKAMATFAAGGSADLQTVILQMQEASLQVKLGVQIRDRLLEAYQDIMRLQV